MAKTGLVQDQRFQKHLAGAGHPERPERLIAIEQALGEAGLTEQCQPLTVQPADIETILRIHSEPYRKRLSEACQEGLPFIDAADSGICPESYDIALLAVGSCLEAVDAVMAGRVHNAFCAVRPPGHHAEADRSMGFCMFNNIAIAAGHLLAKHELSRVMILDFDVHHGNGTQHTFESDGRVFYCSLHGHPAYLYPGTGFAEENGKGKGVCTTLNLPMMPSEGDESYRTAFDEKFLPVAHAFAPEFVLISAGFDAHRDDPLAFIELEDESFDWMTRALCDLAGQHAGGRLISFLEGGYNLPALGRSVVKHVSVLLEHSQSAASSDQ